MRTLFDRARFTGWSLAAWLLVMFLFVLLIGGGASRSDVMGQLVVRTTSVAILITLILAADRNTIRNCGAVPWLLAAIVALPLLQLLPLPPDLWRNLPGRAELLPAMPTADQHVWRPLSLSPGNTINAAISLIVPVTTLALLALLKPNERAWLPTGLLVLVVLSMTIGILQFTGIDIEQRLINYSTDVRGTFANRNHFALLLAVGCLITPHVAMMIGHRFRWLRGGAIGLLLLLILTVLASGSRMGLLLSVIGTFGGGLVAREQFMRTWRRQRKPMRVAGIVGSAAIVAGVLGAAVYMNRAASVERLSEAEVGQDMRIRALPTVIDMVRDYAPFGTGLGSFDPMFRLHEPFALLKPTYFNRAHNDLLEVVLDAGVAGLLLILVAALWWALASWRVWRQRSDDTIAAARIGSATIMLTTIASLVDYPARTPLIMAVVTIAATLLAWGARRRTVSNHLAS
jgi:O-antigen ligase